MRRTKRTGVFNTVAAIVAIPFRVLFFLIKVTADGINAIVKTLNSLRR